MSLWISVCALEDIAPLGARVLRREGEPDIAVFRTADDQVFALEDRCPHKGGALSQGIVCGNKVACPLHNWNIALETGCALAPDEGSTRSYAVRVDNGRVLLELPVTAHA
jgi:nitrite reductase (NADH) small subunit